MKAFILLLLLPITALADSVIGQWTFVDSVQGMQVAKVVNDSGAVTGVICFFESKECAAYLLTSTRCEVGGNYPMMINSSIGAIQATAECEKIDNDHYLVFTNFDDLKLAFESGGEIGMAIPLKDGMFQVVRFGLSGATLAIKRTMTLPSHTVPVKNRSQEFL